MNPTKTKGQIEDDISKKTTKFYFDHLGVGPKETRVYIIHDMIIVRLKGNLLPIEKKLLEAEGGIELVKNIRQALHEITTKHLGTIIEEVTNHKVISSHSDISTKTGERLEVFILDSDYEQLLKKTA
ncbi:MAG: DUF2294 domain-containing protein [Candidatus Roizmanbacteria bacterium]|nr:MAG: DUF2294 domain-containing protein [Candidatus Roizmanbacteria bacterium]